jgi:hypothetical protein
MPIVKKSENRFDCNMISMINNHGKISFIIFTNRFTSAMYLQSLEWMRRYYAGKKIYLIIDRHPVHISSIIAIY